MPVELWLECACAVEVAHAEESLLVVVGNCPALGSWDPAHGAVLRPREEYAAADPHSGAERLRRWVFDAPVRLAEEPPELPRVLEYLYVAVPRSWERGASARKIGDAVWEKLGDFEPLRASTLWEEECQDIADWEGPSRRDTFIKAAERAGSAVTRRRALTRSLPLPGGHVLLLRHDQCGGRPANQSALNSIAVVDVAWRAPQAWDPDIAGGSSEVGGMLQRLGTTLRQQTLNPAEVSALPFRLFVQERRSRLLGALAQLVRQRGPRLPPCLWRQIGELVGGGLGDAFSSKA